MISSPLIMVSANFDSGDFMNFGVVANNPTSYNANDTNIQKVFMLDDKDFNALELLINIAVTDYLKGVQ